MSRLRYGKCEVQRKKCSVKSRPCLKLTLSRTLYTMTQVSCEKMFAVKVVENVLKRLAKIIQFDRSGIFGYTMVRKSCFGGKIVKKSNLSNWIIFFG